MSPGDDAWRVVHVGLDADGGARLNVARPSGSLVAIPMSDSDMLRLIQRCAELLAHRNAVLR